MKDLDLQTIGMIDAHHQADALVREYDQAAAAAQSDRIARDARRFQREALDTVRVDARKLQALREALALFDTARSYTSASVHALILADAARELVR